ncbi:MAG: DUF2480 family protein [Elusimicrobia bacterium]|nr:DUF2480 family protein [Elusimicrobiota bacterium]
MTVVDLSDFLNGGMLREEPFRQAVKEYPWHQLAGKPVLIRGCGSVPIPTWAYLVVTAHAAQHAQSIAFGEEKNPVPVFGRP